MVEKCEKTGTGSNKLSRCCCSEGRKGQATPESVGQVEVQGEWRNEWKGWTKIQPEECPSGHGRHVRAVVDSPDYRGWRVTVGQGGRLIFKSVGAPFWLRWTWIKFLITMIRFLLSFFLSIGPFRPSGKTIIIELINQSASGPLDQRSVRSELGH